MSDRDDMLLEALTSLINANNKQLNERLDSLEYKINQEVSGIKLYIENVLEKKLNAFYDNTVTITEYNALKKEVEELKQTVDDILKKIS
jgi:polyhydroxyalkanoate synthesis regulator phasin